MPRGSPSIHLTLRIRPDLMREIDDAIARANATAHAKSRAVPFFRRSWVAQAIADKLAHLERRRRQTARRTAKNRAERESRRERERVASGPVQNANISVDDGTDVARSFSTELVASDGVASR
jgi:hypothetical protein